MNSGTREALLAMTALLPELETAAPDALCKYAGGLDMTLLGPLRELHSLAYQAEGIVLTDFAWTEWQDEARRLLAAPGEIAQADMQTILQLITTLIRAERFAPGALRRAVSDESMLHILRRVESLLTKY